MVWWLIPQFRCCILENSCLHRILFWSYFHRVGCNQKTRCYYSTLVILNVLYTQQNWYLFGHSLKKTVTVHFVFTFLIKCITDWEHCHLYWFTMESVGGSAHQLQTVEGEAGKDANHQTVPYSNVQFIKPVCIYYHHLSLAAVVQIWMNVLFTTQIYRFGRWKLCRVVYAFSNCSHF